MPDVKYTTWDDYAIMSMVESGLGISILPELILRRIPYKIVKVKLGVPAYRDIAFALRSRKMRLLRLCALWNILTSDTETEIKRRIYETHISR